MGWLGEGRSKALVASAALWTGTEGAASVSGQVGVGWEGYEGFREVVTSGCWARASMRIAQVNFAGSIIVAD